MTDSCTACLGGSALAAAAERSAAPSWQGSPGSLGAWALLGLVYVPRAASRGVKPVLMAPFPNPSHRLSVPGL